MASWQYKFCASTHEPYHDPIKEADHSLATDLKDVNPFLIKMAMSSAKGVTASIVLIVWYDGSPPSQHDWPKPTDGYDRWVRHSYEHIAGMHQMLHDLNSLDFNEAIASQMYATESSVDNDFRLYLQVPEGMPGNE